MKLKTRIKRKIKKTIRKNLLTILISFFFMSIIVFQFLYFKKEVNLITKNYSNLEASRQQFISKNIEVLNKSRTCNMSLPKRIDFLNTLFEKSIEYKDKFYISPDFVMQHIFIESRYNDSALGAAKEYGLFQFHPFKQLEASLIYDIPIEEFNVNLEKQVDFYFKLMTEYLITYNGDYEKALLTYNCGEGVIERFGGDIVYLKDVVYHKHPINPRQAYSDIVMKVKI